MPYRALSQHPDARVPERLGDVRGWSLRDVRGTAIGTVHDLVFLDDDLRYLDVETAGPPGARRVLLPARFAHRGSGSAPSVLLSGISLEQLAALPDHPGDVAHIGHDFIRRIAYALTPGSAAVVDAAGAEPPPAPRAEEELAVRTEPVRVGEVVVRKTVEVEQARVPVTRMRDDVSVERRAVAPGTVTSFEPWTVGEELFIPVVEEELVVETRRVVREVVVVRRHQVKEVVVADAEVRKERVHVDRVPAEDARADAR